MVARGLRGTWIAIRLVIGVRREKGSALLTRWTTVLIFASLALLAPQAAQAAPGELDPSFAGGGFRLDPVFASELTGLAKMDNGARAAALDSSGRLLAVGSGPVPGTITIVRYTTSGQLDPTFGTDGAVKVRVYSADLPPSEANDRNPEVIGAYLQSDGELVIAGNPRESPIGRGFVARFNPITQSLDPSFGTDGVATVPGETVINGLAEDASGRPVLSGSSYPGDLAFVARLTPSGQLDSSFGGAGLVTTVLHGPPGHGPGGGFSPVTTIGNEIVASSTLTEVDGAFVARYKENGELNRKFGKAGVATFFSPSNEFVSTSALRALPNGKLLVIGGFSGPFFIARLTKTGSLDPTFGSYGIVVGNLKAPNDQESEGTSIGSVVLEANGSIVLAGNLNGRGRRCYRARAQLSRRFGGCRPGTADHLALARYLPMGTPDCSFGEEGVVRDQLLRTREEPLRAVEERVSVGGAVIDPQGRLLVAGSDGPPPNYLAAAFQLGPTPTQRLFEEAPHASLALRKRPRSPLSELRHGALHLRLRVRDRLRSRCAKDTLIAVLAAGSPATPRDIARDIVQSEGSGSTQNLVATGGVLHFWGNEPSLGLGPTKYGRAVIRRPHVPKLWLTVELLNGGTGGSRAVLIRPFNSSTRGR